MLVMSFCSCWSMKTWWREIFRGSVFSFFFFPPILVCKGFLKWKQYFFIRYMRAHIGTICLFGSVFGKNPDNCVTGNWKLLWIYIKNTNLDNALPQFSHSCSKTKQINKTPVRIHGPVIMVTHHFWAIFVYLVASSHIFCSMLMQSLNAGVSWLSSLTVFHMSEFA